MKYARYLVCIQGIFYTLTGAWSLVHLSSFLKVTQNFESPFKTQANGVLFVGIGVFLLYTYTQEEVDMSVLTLTAGIALLLSIVDIYYLTLGGTTAPFWADFFEEGLVGIILGAYLLMKII